MGSFWDVVSGKNLRFNTMRSEAHNQVTAALKTFLSTWAPGDAALRTRYSELLRETLFSFFVCANQRVAWYRELESHQEHIRTANRASYLHLIASLHAFQNVYDWRVIPKLAAMRHAGVHAMYKRDDRFALGWLSVLASAPNFSDPKLFELEAGRHLYGEIAPILGLPPPDCYQISLWTHCALSVGYEAGEFVKDSSPEQFERLMNLPTHSGGFQRLEDYTFKNWRPPSRPAAATDQPEMSNGTNNVLEFDKRIAESSEAIALDKQQYPYSPGRWWHYHSRGRGYMGKGALDKAIEDFTVAIRLNPMNGILFYDRAAAYEMAHASDAAMSDFEMAVALGYNR
jgi:tetratricopeptide (TPR) repeat protein